MEGPSLALDPSTISSRELISRLLREPSGIQPGPQGTRPADGVCLPQRLLGYHGRYSTRARGLGLILCGGQFGLSVRELGSQLIDSPAQLLSLSLTGSKCLIGKISARLGRGHPAVGVFKLLA
jgi:hypothetical protein